MGRRVAGSPLDLGQMFVDDQLAGGRGTGVVLF